MRPQITRRAGKGSQLELLPNQRTLSRLVSGDTFERSLNNYAKVTPSGENALETPNIEDMSRVKF
jgi:hypothetical protein